MLDWPLTRALPYLLLCGFSINFNYLWTIKQRRGALKVGLLIVVLVAVC
jgi:hypothetical protein